MLWVASLFFLALSHLRYTRSPTPDTLIFWFIFRRQILFGFLRYKTEMLVSVLLLLLGTSVITSSTSTSSSFSFSLKPKIDLLSSDASPALGAKAKLFCSASAGVVFAWFKDGQLIRASPSSPSSSSASSPSHPRLKIFTSEEESILTVNGITREDNGNYTCKVTATQFGTSAQKTVQLLVKGGKNNFC